ncbi:unnamed protein product [Microthlaspi erraticum]|uniref:Reverse transcriptase Ty1/copia-type domain-containing protein n=1 Tax=Microthlaspi erraticum TaxID=1685480 RepID=A0A6D2IYX2_9BRAS|nr:unnamed protein product [Microthlaspi erraticum]
MWYNRLSEYLLSKDYVNNAICPCVFIKKSSSGFVIIAVYVDDLNMIGTQKEIDDARTHMKEEFEMKDLGKTKFCLGLQIEHFQDGIFVHQSNYTKRVLKRFYMDKATPLSTPMVNRSLDVEKDPFRPCEDNEEVLGPEVPYMSAIGGLMYLANCTRPDIAFATNLLARYRYLSDPHKARSQTGYVFTIGGTAVSWRSQKQTLVATSSNYAETIALHEACRECVWLRSMTHHIQESSGIVTEKEPTKIFEDNSACVTQLKEGYIKSDRTKHIPPRFFSYTQELQKNQEVDIEYIRSSDNAADLFTKALPTTVFKKHVHSIGMRRLKTCEKKRLYLFQGRLCYGLIAPAVCGGEISRGMVCSVVVTWSSWELELKEGLCWIGSFLCRSVSSLPFPARSLKMACRSVWSGGSRRGGLFFPSGGGGSVSSL